MTLLLAKGLYTNPLRIVWPHLGSMAGAIARGLMGAALPRCVCMCVRALPCAVRSPCCEVVVVVEGVVVFGRFPLHDRLPRGAYLC